ncbi:MAG: phosphoribosylamine--glycine ligase [Phycisphaerae bacterium]
MRILVVGCGGREHALVRGLLRSAKRPEVFCAPGNGGTEAPVDGRRAKNVDIRDMDLDALAAFARETAIDLTVIGPEHPLGAGIVDRFTADGLRIFGPTAAAARIEGDKAFAKRLMIAVGVPTAEARIFGPTEDELLREAQPSDDSDQRLQRGIEQACEYILTRDESLVVKAAGPAKGKGVLVCADPAEAVCAAEQLMVERLFGDAGRTILVEERLTGREVSVLALVDGHTIYVLESARDYKRAQDGDAGPNTGGMGSYSASGLLDDATLRQIEETILVPIVDALAQHESPYRGVLYAGLMLTHGGPKVLEFNCRFGDPEAQAILMRLRSDLTDVLEAVVDGRLDQVTLEWDPRPAVCVVMASKGYPDRPETGQLIRGLDAVADEPDVAVFHAGTKHTDKGIVTSGGRVLSVTALGDSVAAARDRAYAATARIEFDGAFYRSDIAADCATA